jgi:hypothetical protein
MAARDQQRNERKGWRVVRQERRQQMAFEVVHAERRALQRGGESTGHTRADEQSPGEPGPRVYAMASIDSSASELRARTSRRQRKDTPDVIARRQLGDDAAIRRMHLHLAVQRVGQQRRRPAGAGPHHCHAGFVARGFDAENVHRQSLRCAPRMNKPALGLDGGAGRVARMHAGGNEEGGLLVPAAVRSAEASAPATVRAETAVVLGRGGMGLRLLHDCSFGGVVRSIRAPRHCNSSLTRT